MSLNSSLDTFAKLQDKRDEARFGFIRQILLMASGLLGILVSLHKTPASDNCTRISFALALGLLSLGILFLSIGLFEQVVVRRTVAIKWSKQILLQIRDENYQPIVVGEPPGIYEICEKIGYVSLILSIICLTVYAILIA
jgi:hypothetical protein